MEPSRLPLTSPYVRLAAVFFVALTGDVIIGAVAVALTDLRFWPLPGQHVVRSFFISALITLVDRS